MTYPPIQSAAAVRMPPGLPATDARPHRTHPPARKILRTAAAAWLVVAIVGQLFPAIYVAGFYGRAALEGRPQDWNEVLGHGYVQGEFIFNAVLASHLLFVA